MSHCPSPSSVPQFALSLTRTPLRRAGVLAATVTGLLLVGVLLTALPSYSVCDVPGACTPPFEDAAPAPVAWVQDAPATVPTAAEAAEAARSIGLWLLLALNAGALALCFFGMLCSLAARWVHYGRRDAFDDDLTQWPVLLRTVGAYLGTLAAPTAVLGLWATPDWWPVVASVLWWLTLQALTLSALLSAVWGIQSAVQRWWTAPREARWQDELFWDELDWALESEGGLDAP